MIKSTKLLLSKLLRTNFCFQLLDIITFNMLMKHFTPVVKAVNQERSHFHVTTYIHRFYLITLLQIHIRLMQLLIQRRQYRPLTRIV